MRMSLQGQPAPLLLGFAEGLRAAGLMFIPLDEALFVIASKLRRTPAQAWKAIWVQTLVAAMVPSPFAHQECGAAADQDFRKRCLCKGPVATESGMNQHVLCAFGLIRFTGLDPPLLLRAKRDAFGIVSARANRAFV